MNIQIKQIGDDLILELPRTVAEELDLNVGDPLRIYLSIQGENISIVYEPVK